MAGTGLRAGWSNGLGRHHHDWNARQRDRHGNALEHSAHRHDHNADGYDDDVDHRYDPDRYDHHADHDGNRDRDDHNRDIDGDDRDGHDDPADVNRDDHAADHHQDEPHADSGLIHGADQRQPHAWDIDQLLARTSRRRSQATATREHPSRKLEANGRAQEHGSDPTPIALGRSEWASHGRTAR